MRAVTRICMTRSMSTPPKPSPGGRGLGEGASDSQHPHRDSLPRLLTWLSPAFPVGAFAYSHGLEWAVEAGDIRDETTLLDWVTDVLRHGAGRTDAILLRHAYRADDKAALAAVAELAEAAQPCRERRAYEI